VLLPFDACGALQPAVRLVTSRGRQFSRRSSEMT
jgi:hypothetical protein